MYLKPTYAITLIAFYLLMNSCSTSEEIIDTDVDIEPETFEIYSSTIYPNTPTNVIPETAQRYIGGPNANDDNNGSKDTPWATFDKALRELCNSKTWYCLNLLSDVTVNEFIDTKFYGSGPGTLEQFVYIRSAPFLEQPAILSLNARVEIDGQQYWLWHNFNIKGNEGINLGQDRPTNYHTFRNIIGNMTGSGGDNHGTFQALNYNANYFGVFNCNLTGPGIQNVHGNTANIIFFGLTHARIENNIFTNAPRPLYFKHSNRAINGKAQIYIRNNYQPETNAGESCFIAGRAQGGTLEISNNIFESPVEISNGGGSEQPEGHFISHNTFASDLKLQNGNDPVINATITNNIVLGNLELLRYGNHINKNTSDYTLINGNIYYQDKMFNLEQWQQNAVPSGQDLNSIHGLPSFVIQSNAVLSYTLAEESLGKNAASDNTDIGVNTTLVGNK